MKHDTSESFSRQASPKPGFSVTVLLGSPNAYGRHFTLARHAGGWIWKSGRAESLPFAEKSEAQADAIRYARQVERGEAA